MFLIAVVSFMSCALFTRVVFYRAVLPRLSFSTAQLHIFDLHGPQLMFEGDGKAYRIVH